MPRSTTAPIDEAQVRQANQRLKLAQLGVTLEKRGNKLNLRGTLPPRPGSDRLRPHQQRLSLNLPATREGLKQAEQTAKVIAAQLIQNSFDWRDYLPIGQGGRSLTMPMPEQIEAFQQHFLGQTTQPHELASLRTSWDKAYAPYLRKLEAIVQERQSLSLVEAIQATIRSTPPNSRSRQVCCTALKAFADFLELELPVELNLKGLWGSYGSNQAQKRDLPEDEFILATWEQIPNPAWRFVYGVMATYGLRNHEVFFCDYTRLRDGDPDASVEVLATTKTGEHEVWPFYPEWVERFNLRNVQLPPVNTDLAQTTLQRIGQLVTNQFRRYQIPFSPYDLRHAWAVRTIHLNIPDTVAAKMMGHSVAIHNRTYHRWITRRDQQQAVRSALEKRVGG
jgi:hypothetical protein